MFKKILLFICLVSLLTLSLICLITNFITINKYIKLLLIVIPELILMLLVVFKWKNFNVLYKLFLTIYLMLIHH
jgi:hypothetical protein